MDKEESKKEKAVAKKKVEKAVQENENADFSLIRSKIYEIRGQVVMFDFDLAEEYEIETAQLKRQVRRNFERFYGDDFMFQLTNQEFIGLRCQFGISNMQGRGGIRYMPFAFTELGIAMLSSVLNSKKAIRTNRKIMRAFVAFRKFLSNYAELNKKLEDLSTKVDKNEAKVEDMLNFFKEYLEHKKELEKPRTMIGFKQSNK